jgi:hypothetical protein
MHINQAHCQPRFQSVQRNIQLLFPAFLSLDTATGRLCELCTMHDKVTCLAEGIAEYTDASHHGRFALHTLKAEPHQCLVFDRFEGLWYVWKRHSEGWVHAGQGTMRASEEWLFGREV